MSVCVLHRSNNPDKATVNDVMKELQDNNIDVSQLVECPADHCQQAESSTEEVRHRDTDVANGTQPTAILDN